jgi:hypothetical protein
MEIALSLVAVAISLISLGWNVYKDIFDKGRLRLNASIGLMVPDPSNKTRLFLKITNVGRQPILVNGWGMYIGKGKQRQNYFIMPHYLPKMLAPGEFVTEMTDPEVLAQDVRSIHAWDSLEKKWFTPPKQVKQVKRIWIDSSL